jgi:Pectate lyase superfamily protein
MRYTRRFLAAFAASVGGAAAIAAGAEAAHIPETVTMTATVLDADTVRVDWQSTRTDVTGWHVGRDGVDDYGGGPWSTEKAAAASTHTFLILVEGHEYTFTLIPHTTSGDLPPTTVKATPASLTPPPGPVVEVTAHGAIPNDSADDTAAINAAVAATPTGGIVHFAAGEYRHNAVIRVSRAGITLAGVGARVTATVPERSAFDINADDVTVNDLQFNALNVTQRWTAPDQHKLTVVGNSGVRFNRVHLLGSAGAGIYLEGASKFVIVDALVEDTRADGVHMTGGSNNGRVVRPTTSRTGDDGVAVVSYADDPAPSRLITVDSPTVNGQSWGRGVSVVGGEDITYRNIRVNDSNGAAVYVAVEPSFTTMSVRRVRVEGGVVVRGNTDPGVGHGAVLVYNGRRGFQIQDVVMRDLDIRDTPTTAPRWVGIIAENGGTNSDVQFNRFALNGTGPSDLLYPGSGGWTATDWTRDGTPVDPATG